MNRCRFFFLAFISNGLHEFIILATAIAIFKGIQLSSDRLASEDTFTIGQWGAMKTVILSFKFQN